MMSAATVDDLAGGAGQCLRGVIRRLVHHDLLGSRGHPCRAVVMIAKMLPREPGGGLKSGRAGRALSRPAVSGRLSRRRSVAR
jgi:hypothetical protein